MRIDSNNLLDDMLNETYNHLFSKTNSNENMLHDIIRKNEIDVLSLSIEDGGYNLCPSVLAEFIHKLPRYGFTENIIDYILGIELYAKIFKSLTELPCQYIGNFDSITGSICFSSQELSDKTNILMAYKNNTGNILVSLTKEQLAPFVIERHQKFSKYFIKYQIDSRKICEIGTHKHISVSEMNDIHLKYCFYKCEYILGLVTAAYDSTLERLATRKQFNKKMIDFQSIRLRMAKVLTLISLYSNVLKSSYDKIKDETNKASYLTMLLRNGTYILEEAFGELIQLNGASGFTNQNKFSQYQIDYFNFIENYHNDNRDPTLWLQ